MKRSAGIMSLLTLAGASAASSAQGQSSIRLIDRIDHATSRLTAGFEGDEVVSLRAESSAPVAAFARAVGLAPDSVATVRVRVRLEGERRVPVRLEVGALRRAPASPEAEITSSDRIGLEPGSADPPVRVVDGSAADEWQDLEMFVGSRPGRRGISIAISAVGDSFTVEKCEVFEPPAWQRALVGLRLPHDIARDAWRRFVKLDDETMESVILGAGDRLCWRLVVPAAQAWLHASVAMVGPPPPPDAAWRVAIDGQPLMSQPLSASGSGFTPWSADLSEFAGREVKWRSMRRRSSMVPS